MYFNIVAVVKEREASTCKLINVRDGCEFPNGKFKSVRLTSNV